jgi:hypothetical protein
MTRPWKYCTECGGHYPLGFFRRTRVRVAYAYATSNRRPICKGCEQTARDKEKAENSWRVKATSTRRHHARRLKQSVAILEQQYGWQLDQMAHDVEHTYSNNCKGCRKPFGGMLHGHGDITLDITDPEKEPFYLANTQWICATCNREKARTPPDEWAETCIGWPLFEHQQILGPRQGSLPFEG